MTLRETLVANTVTHQEIQKAEAVAAERAALAPSRTSDHLSRMIEERITECRTFHVAAAIIQDFLPAKQLDSELPPEKEASFIPMKMAKMLLLQIIDKK